MLENIKKIDNPLTIVAIFAGISEIAATISLGIVDTEMQKIFIWFVMLFPLALILCFFITLNFNPKVIYSPSDFKDEKNFLITWGIHKINVPANSFNDISKAIEKQYNLIKEKRRDAKYVNEFKIYADDFFAIFTEKLGDYIDRKYISAIGFGPQLKGFYILGVNISPKYAPLGICNHVTYLIHIRKVDNQIVAAAAGVTKETKDLNKLSLDIVLSLKESIKICIHNEKISSKAKQ